MCACSRVICCLQTALGLQHMHSQCILHRDIKSLNLLLTADMQIKIGDLGIATVSSGIFRYIVGARVLF